MKRCCAETRLSSRSTPSGWHRIWLRYVAPPKNDNALTARFGSAAVAAAAAATPRSILSQLHPLLPSITQLLASLLHRHYVGVLFTDTKRESRHLRQKVKRQTTEIWSSDRFIVRHCLIIAVVWRHTTLVDKSKPSKAKYITLKQGPHRFARDYSRTLRDSGY